MGNTAGPVYLDLSNEKFWYKRVDGSVAGPFDSRTEAETMQTVEEAPTGLQLQPRRHDGE